MACRRMFELALLLLILICKDGSIAHATSLENNEYAVKAAFLFHFAQLTNWPPGVFQNTSDPLNICTTGTDPFNGALEKVLAEKIVQDHAVRIVHLKRMTGVEACQVLFIGASEGSHLAALLANLQNLPILTAGETDGFTQLGGMIGFRPEQGRLRFEINVTAAEKCNLSFGSQLLSLAKTIISTK